MACAAKLTKEVKRYVTYYLYTCYLFDVDVARVGAMRLLWWRCMYYKIGPYWTRTPQDHLKLSLRLPVIQL